MVVVLPTGRVAVRQSDGTSRGYVVSKIDHSRCSESSSDLSSLQGPGGCERFSIDKSIDADTFMLTRDPASNFFSLQLTDGSSTALGGKRVDEGGELAAPDMQPGTSDFAFAASVTPLTPAAGTPQLSSQSQRYEQSWLFGGIRPSFIPGPASTTAYEIELLPGWINSDATLRNLPFAAYSGYFGRDCLYVAADLAAFTASDDGLIGVQLFLQPLL